MSLPYETPRAFVDSAAGLSMADVAIYAEWWLAEHGLNENQAVFSLLGLDGIIQPRMADDAGRGRLIDTGDLDKSALLAVYGLNYLPNRQKLRPRDLSDTQWNMALHLFNEAIGGVLSDGRSLNNVPKSFGIDLATQAGLGELELELAGKPSAFDAIQLELSEDQYSGILSYVRRITVGKQSEAVADVLVEWLETTQELLEAVFSFQVLCEQMLAEVVRDKALVMTQREVMRLTDMSDLLVRSYREAQLSLAGLRNLEQLAEASQTSTLVSLSSALDRGRTDRELEANELERQMNLLTGALIQSVVHNIAGAVAPADLLAHLESLLADLRSRSEDDGAEASELYVAIGRELGPLLREKQLGQSTGPQRPDWLKR